MNRLTIKTCPLCGGSRLVPFLECTDRSVSGERFTLMECVDCGFRMTQGVPVESEIGAYYATPSYISHSDTHKGIVNKLYHVVRRYMLARKARLVRKALHRKSGRLLDIGTGTGYFVHAMYVRGWDVEAVEKSAEARAFARTRFGLEVQPETALDTYKSGSFDVITLWHVMEHIERLDELWSTLYRLLHDKGVLVVAVPNSASFDAKKYGADWAAYDVPRHLWHFTPATMQRFALKNKFILEQHRPMPFDAFYISMLSERYRKHCFPFLRGLCTGIQAGVSALGKKGRSSSVIYIFRKKQ